MKKTASMVVAFLAFSALAGCSGGDVDWENYSASVKSRIDGYADQGNCAALQDEFDAASANDDAQRARVGDGNSDLLSYIDGKLQDAGCY